MSPDRWAAWFADRRHGGDEAARRAIVEVNMLHRNRVVEAADIRTGDVVLDVGCGDGLIAVAALERVGATGRVVFLDISRELLDTCRARTGGDRRCEFVCASVTELPFPDASVDVVTGAAVLIYVPEKQRAFDELHRVLRPGGRLSLYEPLNSFGFPEPPETFYGIPVGEMRPLTERVRDVWRAIDLPEHASMHDWNERDLLAWAEHAGFVDIRCRAEYTVAPNEPVGDFEVRIRSAGNPLVPSILEATHQALDPADAARFLAWLRPRMESGAGVQRSAESWLRAGRGV